MLIDVKKSCLLVIDMQAKLTPTIDEIGRVVSRIAMLLKGASILGVPSLVSEQYSKGLGKTVEELAPLLTEGSVVEKNTFSCMAEEDYARRFNGLGRGHAVVAGVEAHVCVLQTCMELLTIGHQVFVVEDATSSRTPENHRAAIRRLAAAGAHIVTTEMVLFEWMGRSGTPEFKEINALIKETS